MSYLLSTNSTISILLFSLIFFFLQLNCCQAGDYTNSAHGQKIERTAMAAAGYSTGNCGHCHEQHASVLSDAGNPNIYLGFGSEENLCYGCHGYGGAGSATDNIEIDITKNYSHDTTSQSNLHTNGESQHSINSNKHIECTDCHNPHKVGSTLHSTGSNDIAGNGPLYGATGVEPTLSDLNWTAPESYSELQEATKEYQICFKCHSGANTNVTTWGGAGPLAWTDVGLEFSPANRSGHPIITGLNNYPNSISGNNGWNANKIKKGLTSSQLSGPWQANAGEQTMYCSDCHRSNSGAAGPHGSNYKWMLGGTNKAWPYLHAANNGTNLQDSWTVTNPSRYWYNDSDKFRRLGDVSQSAGTDDGLFCLNCHPVSGTNRVHNQSQHNPAGRCVDCHIRVPHGGKVSRLIAAVNADTYAAGNMPLRYTATGDGKAAVEFISSDGYDDTVPIIRQFTKCSIGDYQPIYCYSKSKFDPRNYSTFSCAQGHDNGGSKDGTVGLWSNPDLVPESW